MGWNYLSIPKLQRCNRWSLGMDTQFHLTLYWACDYLSILGLKLNHVSERGPWIQPWMARVNASRGVTEANTITWLIAKQSTSERVIFYVIIINGIIWGQKLSRTGCLRLLIAILYLPSRICRICFDYGIFWVQCASSLRICTSKQWHGLLAYW